MCFAPPKENGTSCPFWRPARALLGTPWHGVAPPDPRGGPALPRCRRNGSPFQLSLVHKALSSLGQWPSLLDSSMIEGIPGCLFQ